jgi:hypothetical protein
MSSGGLSGNIASWICCSHGMHLNTSPHAPSIQFSRIRCMNASSSSWIWRRQVEQLVGSLQVLSLHLEAIPQRRSKDSNSVPVPHEGQVGSRQFPAANCRAFKSLPHWSAPEWWRLFICFLMVLAAAFLFRAWTSSRSDSVTSLGSWSCNASRTPSSRGPAGNNTLLELPAIPDRNGLRLQK